MVCRPRSPRCEHLILCKVLGCGWPPLHFAEGCSPDPDRTLSGVVRQNRIPLGHTTDSSDHQKDRGGIHRGEDALFKVEGLIVGFFVDNIYSSLTSSSISSVYSGRQ